MSRREINRALAETNPVSREAAGGLEIGSEDGDLLAEVFADGRSGSSSSGAERITPTVRRRSRPRYVAAIVAAAAAVALVIVALGGSGDSPDQATPAYGAELVRFAETSPLLLMEAPGWQVSYADESSVSEGEMRFQHGADPIPVEHVTVTASGELIGELPPATRQRGAELSWRAGPLETWLRDRAASAEVTATAPVLDTTAQVFQYEGGSPGDRDITALWTDQGRVMEFRSSVPSMAVFKERLASLRRVDTDTWLGAMPASVVKAAGHESAVEEMLVGIPLPPGFDPKQIPDAGLTTDRYQLGATVSGTVACSWFKLWAQARSRGDEAAAARATAALAGAKNWPVLRQMADEGAYGEVLEEYAAAMPSGTWYGRPLVGDVNSGLGCAEKGVQL